VGRLTSVGISPSLGPVAMGYVHRSRFEPGTAVEVEGAPATVEALPFPQ
jgi:glycine cleavage system aminomethyltransferase T